MNNTNYAGFLKRLGAYIIDGIILSIPMYMISFMTMGSMMGADPDDVAVMSDEMLGNLMYIYLSFFIITFLYYSLFESSSWQATPGKKLLQIKVTDMSGERIGFLRAIGRNIGKMLSGFILLIGFLMAAFTSKKQALHDMMASCLVLNQGEKEDLNVDLV